MILRPAEDRDVDQLAEEDDRILGFVTVGPRRDDAALPDTAEVGAIYVRPEHWHTGAGTKLWGKALDWAMEHDAKWLTAWTYEQNRRALAFYKAMGCSPTDDRKFDTIAGEEIPAILVRMPVPSTTLSDR